MTTIHEQAHERITGFRNYLHREAGERVWSVGGALRVHLNNFSVDVLKDYIALSRHQFELIEFVTQRTGMDTGEPVKFEVMNWSTGKPDIWIDRGKPRTDEVPEWELEMLEDMAWRAQAMGRSLSRFEQNMTISTPADLMELSRHQCEMLNFLKTGSFRKVPGRRKARTISGGGSTPQSEERIKILGEALKEYQGRIEIRNVREFIALSKHQCELAGLMFAEHESGQPIFEVVHYGDAYEAAKSESRHTESDLSCSDLVGASTVVASEKSEALDSRFCGNDGREEPAIVNPSYSGLTGVSRPDGHACEGRLPQFQSVKLSPDTPDTLPRVPLLPGGKVPLPTDGRWVRVDTPDGPMAMRSIPPPGSRQAVWFDDVWEDDYWDEDWDDP